MLLRLLKLQWTNSQLRWEVINPGGGGVGTTVEIVIIAMLLNLGGDDGGNG